MSRANGPLESILTQPPSGIEYREAEQNPHGRMEELAYETIPIIADGEAFYFHSIAIVM